MVWVKIDDAAPTHPKHMKAGVAAFGLWTAALCYANRHATDGVIPADLRLVCPMEKKNVLERLASRLIEEGLWATNDAKQSADRASNDQQAFIICNYTVFQEQALRERQVQKREAERLRKQRFREKTTHVPSLSQRDTFNVPHLSQHPDPDPIPTRPITQNIVRDAAPISAKPQPALAAKRSASEIFDLDSVAQAFSEARINAKGYAYKRQHSEYRSLQDAAELFEAEAHRLGKSPFELARLSATNYCADDWAKRAGFPAPHWLKDPAKYLARAGPLREPDKNLLEKLNKELSHAVRSSDEKRIAEIKSRIDAELGSGS